MKTKLLLSLLLSFYFCLLSSQVPQGFSYQAIARDGSGNPITGATIKVKLSVLSDSLNFYYGTGGVYVWEEEHINVKTNAFGLFTLVMGNPLATKVQGSAASFSAINWSTAPLYVGTKIANPTTYKVLGAAKLWTVPYSMVSGNLAGPLKKLAVTGESVSPDSVLFEVKNKSGQTIFAVYNEGVRIYVDDGKLKGSTKGGFAIGGFGTGKLPSQSYFVVSPDSIRAYINDNPLKATKGGFAIGGFDKTKGGNVNFLNVATDANGIINPSQNRILWYPIKNSFLTGKVLVEHPDSVGWNSFATGFESKAKGQFSQALGYSARARGDFSTAIGKNSVAKGEGSYSFGTNAQAIGKGSFALGSVGIDSAGSQTGQTTASGENAFAIGFGSKAAGIGSFAIGVIDSAAGPFSTSLGYATRSRGTCSITMGGGTIVESGGWFATAAGIFTKAGAWAATSFGDKTYASGHTSFATGFSTIASGQLSATFGDQSKASGYASVAMGYNTTAQSFGSLVLGKFNVISGSPTVWYSNEPALVIGNGTSSLARSNAFTVYKNGNADFAGNGNFSGNGYFGGNITSSGYGNFGGNGYFGGYGNFDSYINLNINSTGRAIYVNSDEALWYNGTCFSWGYGGTYNFIARKTSIGIDVNSSTYMLYVNGSTYSSGGYSSSDIRWKKNLHPLDNKIDALMHLNGYEFNWRKDEFPEMNFGSEIQIGLVAQEVEKIFPELVRTDDKGFKAVSYEKLSVLLLEGMKEQQAQINTQNQKIEKLEKLVEQLISEKGLK